MALWPNDRFPPDLGHSARRGCQNLPVRFGAETRRSANAPVADILCLGDDPAMLILILLSLVLLACNVIYCGQRTLTDWKQARNTQATWGLLALSGALIALVAMVWALLASLAHY
jgi:hypothetical protein